MGQFYLEDGGRGRWGALGGRAGGNLRTPGPPEGECVSASAAAHCPPPLNASERCHLYDVAKLSILIDCLWFFDRGGPADFYGKRKIERLNAMGREGFYGRMFG